jgi:glycosyltransferase involved in cell wall biosynthesis
MTVSKRRDHGSRLRVCHLTSNHQPFDPRIFLKECRTLAKAGYDVTLVVPHTERLVRDGVKIEPVPVPSTRRQRMLRTTWLVLREALRVGADVYHLHDSELIPIGWILKLRGRRVIFDAHEDRPKQILSKPWIHPSLRPAVAAVTRLVERASAAVFDRVVAVTPSVAATFPPHKTHLVQNYPIPGELAAITGIPYEERPPEVVFVGGINEIRGIHEMVQAMEHLPADSASQLVLIGRFDDPAVERAVRRRPGWKRVRAVGWQSRDEVAAHLARARAGLVLYHPEPNHVSAQPNKLFEYMSAGLPVIASDFPLWRDIVLAQGAGLLVDPLDPKAIADKMLWLLEHPDEAHTMGENGRSAVADTLNWDHEAEELLAMYATLS